MPYSTKADILTEISEDDLHRFQNQVQKVTDAHTAQVDQLEKAKAEEIMQT